MNIIDNYFEPEAAIVARVKEQVAGLKDVYTPFDLAGMVEASQASPAVHVIYAGDAPPSDAAGRGEVSALAQRWLVVLAVRSSSAQLQQTSDIRQLAGATIPVLLRSLQGWQPVTWMRPLKRVPGPPAGYSPAFAYFPFMFEGRFVL